MSNIVTLVACLLIGMALRHLKLAPENASATLNVFVIYISLPALVIFQVHSVNLELTMLYAAAMPWLVFICSIGLFLLIGSVLRLDRLTTGSLAVVAGLGNTSFVGLPMIEAFYGPSKMPLGVIIDQLGTYLVLSTAGIAAICYFAGKNTAPPLEIARKIATFPPLIALIISFVLIPFAFPDWLISLLLRLGNTLAPLALVSVGLQLRLGAIQGRVRALALGLSYKLVMAPALMLLFYSALMHVSGPSMQVTVFEAAMAPQIGGSIVAVQYGLDAKLITLLVGIGTIFSFATLPLWNFAIAGL